MRTYEPFTSDEQIAAIGRGFCDRTLPKPRWTHAAHYAATLWLLVERPEIELARDMPALIRAYNLHTGGENSDTAGYHETITQASIRAARWFLGTHPSAALGVAHCCNALLASRLGDPEWLLDHWTRERLFSVQARKRWLDPDRAPLPYP